jgi:dTDP-glucose 4,6-dehydratase
MQKTPPLISQVDLNYMFEGVKPTEWDFFRGKRIFITGGSGFIGKWLLAALLEADRRLALGCVIEILTRSPLEFIRNAPQISCSSNVTLRQGDVRTFEFPSGNFEIVVHAATDVAQPASPWETFATCIEGTKHVLDFARHCHAEDFLLTSSGAIYGRHPEIIGSVTEEYNGGPNTTSLDSAYGEGKRVSEWLSFALAAETGIKIKVARIYAQIGPWIPLDKHFAIGNFINDVLANRNIIIRGDGTPIRSYLYAADTAIWLWAMVVRSNVSRVWNVGGSDGISIANLAKLTAETLGFTKKIIILQEADKNRSIDAYVPNVNRAKFELDIPSPLSLSESITRTAKWVQEHNLVKP